MSKVCVDGELDEATIDDVAKRRNTKSDTSSEPQKRPNRTGKPLMVWLPGQLRDAIDAAAEQGRRSLTNEVIMALESHLKSLGLWPPPPKSEAKGHATRKPAGGGKS